MRRLLPQVLFFIYGIFLTSTGYAQGRSYEKAEEYFSAHKYEKALELYDKIAESDPQFEDVNYKREICLLLTEAGDSRTIERFLGFENTYGRSDDHYFYWLGQIYTRRYQIDEALKSFERFQQAAIASGISDEEFTQDLITHTLLLKEYFENPDSYEIHQLETPINSRFTELSPVYSSQKDELLFASNRNPSGEKPYKIYYSVNKEGTWSPLVEVSALGAFSESNVNIEVVNEDGKLFIFREENGGDLFYSVPEGNSWTEPVEFDSKVSNNHLASHFFINEHEDRIIFASDENKMGLDIYESFKDPENGKWSRPRPFHSAINSEYDEDSPYLSPGEDKIYFCSNRPGGVGGYDIYVSEFDASTFSWSEPVNMGWPINSPDDELHFKMNPDQASGYFTSNRLHTKGSFDIYFFWHVDKVKVEGRIFDNSAKGPLTNAEIRFHPSQYLDEYFGAKIDNTGRYSTNIISDEVFRVEILKNGEVIYDGEFEIHASGEAQTTHIKDFSVN